MKLAIVLLLVLASTAWSKPLCVNNVCVGSASGAASGNVAVGQNQGILGSSKVTAVSSNASGSASGPCASSSNSASASHGSSEGISGSSEGSNTNANSNQNTEC